MMFYANGGSCCIVEINREAKHRTAKPCRHTQEHRHTSHVLDAFAGTDRQTFQRICPGSFYGAMAGTPTRYR